MAKVVEKRSDGTAVIEVPPADGVELEVGASVDILSTPSRSGADLPWPFGALAGKYPPLEIGAIEAARREALLGKAEQPT